MSGKPAARLGDPTDCPKKGHGANPIAAGSPDVLFDGLPAARMGDPTSCGSALASAAIPTVLINGKPATTVGTTGDHGNPVIAGSGTVIIGTSHTPAPFVPPELLNIASAARAMPASPALPQPPATPMARAWQEEPGDLAPLGLEEEGEEEELDEQPQQQVRQAVTLRIGVFFDGTGNNLANAVVTEQCRHDDLQLVGERTLQEVMDYCQRHGFSDSNGDGYFTQAPDGSYGNAPSNVARLYGLYRDDTDQPLAADAESAVVRIYLEGIGTSSGEADSLYGQITGRGDTGIQARVRQSPVEIVKQLRRLLENTPDLQIDTLEFDIFGFSRGAAAARHFANELLKPGGGVLAGTLQPGQFGLVDGFDWTAHARINFIGLFDTVAAVIDPLNGDYDPANHLNPGINLYLPPGCAHKVLQLTARDEKRWNFALNRVAPHHQEISLPGAHSDIGGGYRPLMLERLLLSRPLSSTVPADTPPKHTYASRETWRQHHQWEALGLPGEGLMRPKVWASRKPVFRERGFQRPPEDVVYGLLPIERRVRGELSLIYLRVMRQLAVQYGVPFDFIDEQESATAMPHELQKIADQLLAYAQGGRYGLDEEDERLLWSRYIHLSAHWTPSRGLLISKPAPNVRLAYNNKPQQDYPE